MAKTFGEWPLWVASYRNDPPLLPVGPAGEPAPWKTWTIHQHSNKGIVAGIRSPVDLNRFRGDEAALRRWAGVADTEPAPPLMVGSLSVPDAVSELERLAAGLKAGGHVTEACRLMELANKLRA